VTTAKPSRGRSVLVAILGILACLAMTISVTTLWVHQIALNTDRYVEVVSAVAADAEVIDEVSTNLAERITTRVVDRVDLPPFVAPLLQDWLQEQIASFMASEAFSDGWAAANRVAHSALVRVLRSEAILGEEPVTISVAQLLVIGIERLQEAGVVPDDIQLPDPLDEDAVEAVRAILAERLDIDIPPGFGEITLVRSERLETARQFVRIFDIVTVASVLITLGLVLLTIWLARDRLRAVLLLGIGMVLALLAAVASTSVIGGFVANALAEAGATNTIAALVNALLGNLASALVVVVVVAVLATVGIMVIGRQPSPAEAMAGAAAYPLPWTTPSADDAMPAPPPLVIPEEEPAAADAKPPSKAVTKPAAKPPAKKAAKPRAKSPGKPPPQTPS
jgi:hypothetical protein